MAVLAVQTSLGYMTVAALLLLQAPPFFFSAFSHWENKKENAPILRPKWSLRANLYMTWHAHVVPECSVTFV